MNNISIKATEDLNSVPMKRDIESSSDQQNKKDRKNDDNGTNKAINEQQRIILFYKYHPLSSDQEKMEPYRAALEKLCSSLRLTGRILIGCSDNGEGINGTLAGNADMVRAFTHALLGREYVEKIMSKEDSVISCNLVGSILDTFWEENEKFAHSINIPVFTMKSPDDFKWSASTEIRPLFPDLNIKLVKEIIGTGGSLSSISLEETAQGYFTPQEWHTALSEKGQDTILIDCRNTKECQIGKFPNAVDPGTTTFAQFPRWVQNNRHILSGKKVMMYCTGGIRCEKASAYIRNEVEGVQDVKHLKGGIHKYLEEYGPNGLWKGKNFVFDGRGAANAVETKLGKDDGGAHTRLACNSTRTGPEDNSSDDIVGRCLYCACPFDTFDPGCVCTVCREPTLVCTACRTRSTEFHCRYHTHLRSCYFTNLTPFSMNALAKQLKELDSHIDAISIGRKYKQKRKTLEKQYAKVQERLVELGTTDKSSSLGTFNVGLCRNCGEAGCSGACWGFHGLKRKEILEEKAEKKERTPVDNLRKRQSRQSSNQRASKQLERQRVKEEIKQLRLSLPPSEYRDEQTGIRVPPPCTRTIQTSVKGKWCGKSARKVLQDEFADFSDDAFFGELLKAGLLRLNDVSLSLSTVDQPLKNMDIISRVVHWHEPPIIINAKIPVQKITLPKAVQTEYHIMASSGSNDDPAIYVCNKNSSVPVHPAGPYFSNTLTLMVEAQENLEPRSLIPCHRIDRVTSGLTLCCTDVAVARLIQSKIAEGLVSKIYLAKVKGNFAASKDGPPSGTGLPKNNEHAMWSWHEDTGSIQVDAPVETIDPKNGIRTVSPDGKPSCSRFRFLSYDSKSDSSLIACHPVTGRGHQLRVHLQWLRFPIWDDTQYGGPSEDGETIQRDQVLSQMVNSINMELVRDASNIPISDNDLQSVKACCRYCRGGEKGLMDSFTPAQLLESGHSICLHAFRYSIPIHKKKKKEKPDEEIAVINVEVDLPEWAKPFELASPI